MGRGTSEFSFLALRGMVPGVQRIIASGVNTDIDIVTVPEDIWGGSLTPNLIPRPAVAESWEIVSSNINDTALGTGARTVTIITLGQDYQQQIQVVALNGTTPVALTGTHRFINLGIVLTAGSARSNIGTLTIRVAGGGAQRGVIDPTKSILNQAKWTTPAGFTTDILQVFFGMRLTSIDESVTIDAVSGNPDRELSVAAFTPSTSGTTVFQTGMGDGNLPLVTLEEREELTARVVGTAKDGASVNAIFIGLMYDNAIWGPSP